jgi:hypothetical protein
MSKHQFTNGHVYREIEGGTHYLATEFEGSLWLYQLVPPSIAHHYPFASSLLGFVCKLGETDWYLITCTDPGPPVKAKFDWVADFIERREFEHVSDPLRGGTSAADHYIDETAKELLEQLDW